MSDISRARELAINAETQIENVFHNALDALHAHNSRLLRLHTLIKEAQPVASGAVCLELYPCSKNCTGCPHPRWVKYNWVNGRDGNPVLVGVNLDAQKKEPILALSRKAPHFAATSALIREAKSILTVRARLLSSIYTLRNILKV